MTSTTTPIEQRIDLVFEGSQLFVEWPDGPQAGQRRPVDVAALMRLLDTLHKAEAVPARCTPLQAADRHKAREALGRALFELLDGPTLLLRRRLEEPLDRLRLRLVGSQNPTVALRWEVLHGPAGWLFDGVRAPALIVQVGGPARSRPQGRPLGTLRVLFMAASPRGVQPELDYEAEEERVLSATAPFVEDGRLRLDVVEDGNLEALSTQLKASRYDAVHLTCHGGMTPAGPRLVFEDSTGDRRDVSAEELAEALNACAEPPGLIMVSACHSADPTGAVGAFIAALLQEGLPAAVGWARPVLDRVATDAATELYQRLAQGQDVASAVAAARDGLARSARKNQDPSAAWATLRLLSAEGGGMSIDPTGPRDPARSAVATYTFLGAGQVHVLATGFVGRRRELQRLLRLLRSGQDEGQPVAGALLVGMKGQGKSCLAARAIARFEAEQSGRGNRVGLVVVHGRLTEGSVLNALINQSQRWGDTKAEELLSDSKRPAPARIRSLLTGSWKGDRLVILLDDFEQSLLLADDGSASLRPESIEVLDALLRACREARPKLLLTSTAAFSPPSGRPDLAVVALGALSTAAARRLWLRHLGNAQDGVSPEAWATLAERLGHNPRALDWARRLIQGDRTDELQRFADGLGEQLAAAALHRPLIPEEQEQVVRLYLQHMAFAAAEAGVSADARTFIARARVYERAVSVEGLSPLAEGLSLSLPGDLVGLANLGLLEAGEDRGMPLYRVSPLVLQRFQSDDDVRWHAVAARFLGAHAKELDVVREAWEHALAGGEAEVAVAMGVHLRTSCHHGGDPTLERQLAERQLGRFPGEFLAWQWAGEAAYRWGDVQLASERTRRAEEVAAQREASAENRANLLHERATVLRAVGDLDGARHCLERSLQLQRSVYNTDEHPGIATTLHALAGVLQALGDLKAARATSEKSLAVTRHLLGTDEHLDVASSLHGLATVRLAQGDLSGAQDNLEQSLSIQLRLRENTEHPQYASCLETLAVVLQARGDLKGALARLEESLGITMQLFGVEKHPTVAVLLYSAGIVLHAQGNLDDARLKLENSLGISRDLYPTDDHPDIAATHG